MTSSQTVVLTLPANEWNAWRCSLRIHVSRKTKDGNGWTESVALWMIVTSRRAKRPMMRFRTLFFGYLNCTKIPLTNSPLWFPQKTSRRSFGFDEKAEPKNRCFKKMLKKRQKETWLLGGLTRARAHFLLAPPRSWSISRHPRHQAIPLIAGLTRFSEACFFFGAFLICSSFLATELRPVAMKAHRVHSS